MAIAASNGSSISSSELFLLLPPGTFTSSEGLEQFVSNDQVLRNEIAVSRGEFAPQGLENLTHDQAEQVILTSRRVQLAQLFADQFVKACPWIRLVAISGSTAYGRTKARDDVDFFVVTRRNRLWITLLCGLVLSKIQRIRDRSIPVFCFNRILDESQCEVTFRTEQEPLLAREALSMRVLSGDSYYHGLVKSSSWMAELFPARYDQALAGGPVRETYVSNRGCGLWSIANWIAFGALVPYATLVSQIRNRRLRQSGNTEALFRTVIRRGFFAYESRKFDQLKETYRGAF